MKKWFKRLKNEKGMTLVELLAVVVILGIVAAIAVPSIGNIIDNSKKDAHVSNALLIINAAKLGKVTEVFTTADELTSSTTTVKDYSISTLVSKGVLDANPKDPDSNSAYEAGSFVRLDTSTNKYSIYLLGGKRKIGTGSAPATEESLNNNGKSLVVPK